MSQKEKKILEAISAALPNMSKWARVIFWDMPKPLQAKRIPKIRETNRIAARKQ